MLEPVVGGTYDYSVTAPGFETKTGSLTLLANTTLTVVMSPPSPANVTDFLGTYDNIYHMVHLSWDVRDPIATHRIVSSHGLGVTQQISNWVAYNDELSLGLVQITITYTIYTVVNGVESSGVSTEVDVTNW